MSLALLVFIGLLGIGVSQQSPVHPAAIALVLNSETTSLKCRESTGPASVLDAKKPSRAANFSMTGSYECTQPLFTPEERDPLNDLVIEASIGKARQVAARLPKNLKSIAVEVVGDEPQNLKDAVATIYRAEIASALGQGFVLRQPAADSSTLTVELLRVDNPDLVSRARISPPNSKGDFEWLD